MRDPVMALFAAGGDFDPWLLAPDQTSRVQTALRALANHPDSKQLMQGAERGLQAFHGAQDDGYWPLADSWESHYKPYVVRNHVLLVPVKGVLLHDYPYQVGTYATGYYYIQRALERGLKDPDVKGIAFIVDSPGGHVAGCFELCDKIHAARGEKPLHAFAAEHAYSAAYAVASAAKDITVSRTGGVGSIGVITMHVSWEKALEEAGIEVTFVFAGKHKKDGNPYEALSEDARTRIQTRIDDAYSVFVRQVSRNRDMKESLVRNSEALTFLAGEAVDREFADKIGPLDESLAAFCASLEVNEVGDDEMTTQATPAAPAATVSQADLDAAVAAAGVAAKKRIADIKACDEAKDRPAAAESVALNTDLDLAAAKTFLASLPKEAPAVAAAPTNDKGSGGFERAMDRAEGGPGAGDEDEAEAPQPGTDKAADATRDRILGNVFGAREAKK